jgi:hypothetical protein
MPVESEIKIKALCIIIIIDDDDDDDDCAMYI